MIVSRSATSPRSHFSSSGSASPLPCPNSCQSRTASKPAILCPIGRSDNTRSDQKRFSTISRELNLMSFALNKARGSGRRSCDRECERGCEVNGGTSETLGDHPFSATRITVEYVKSSLPSSKRTLRPNLSSSTESAIIRLTSPATPSPGSAIFTHSSK